METMLRDYNDARRRENEWRTPQILLALVAPTVTFMSVLFAAAGETRYATISGAIALTSGVGAALLAVEVWRWHRTALSIVGESPER